MAKAKDVYYWYLLAYLYGGEGHAASKEVMSSVEGNVERMEAAALGAYDGHFTKQPLSCDVFETVWGDRHPSEEV